jgi:hypothetical protein
MTPNIFHSFDNQRSFRLVADVIQELRDAGEMPAWENVFVDKAALKLTLQ